MPPTDIRIPNPLERERTLMRLIRLTALTAALTLGLVAAASAAPLSPGTLAFGTQAVGSASPEQTATLTNTRASQITVGTVTLTGTAANQYAIVDEDCTGALAPGASCEIDVRLQPTSAGAKAASLSVATDSGTLASSLTGRGDLAGLSPTARSFGSVLANTGPGASTVFTVLNPAGGAGPMNLGTLTIGGANGNQFLKTADGCSGRTVELGGSCTFEIAFSPTSLGAKAGTVTLERTDSTPFTATLTGTGTAPAAGVAEILPLTALRFGTTVALGKADGRATATLVNRTAEYVNLGQATLAGANPGQYLLHPDQDRCSGTAVAPGGSCSVDISFLPTSVGSKPATLSIALSDGSVGFTRNLTGTAIATTVTPYRLDFGSVPLGETTATLTGTLNNVSALPLEVTATTLTGTAAAMYAIPAGGDGCVGQTVPAGESCTVEVEFTPASIGSKAGNVSFTTSAGAITYPLTGIGSAVHIGPSTLEFGAHSIQTGPSAEKVFTVTNADSTAIDPYWVYLSGTNADEFEIVAEDCTDGPIQSGDACSVTATFDPATAGARSATLNLVSSSALEPNKTAELTGEAVTEKISISPARVQFGKLVIGETAPVRNLTVTNTSGGRSTLGQLTAEGGAFRVVGDSCSGQTLPAAGTCTLGVEFASATVGEHTGTLTVPVPATGAEYASRLLGTAEAAPIVPPDPDPDPEPVVKRPANVKRPVLKGKAKLGARLTCSKGTWRNSPSRLKFSWLRNGKAVKGKAGAGYRITRKDIGKRLRCRVTASNSAGSANALSKRVVKPKSTKRDKTGRNS